MTYALVLMDDHRDYLTSHRHAILGALPTAPDLILEHVDTQQRGFTAQMLTLWDELRAVDVDHVLLWEADFLPVDQAPLEQMTALLDHPDNAQIAQVALVRQPWFANEHTAGGLLAALEAQGCTFTDHGGWLEHSAGWTNNPCLFRRALVDHHDWPNSAWSESQFGRRLVAFGHRFAYYGQRNDDPRVTHVGERTDESHGY